MNKYGVSFATSNERQKVKSRELKRKIVFSRLIIKGHTFVINKRKTCGLQ